VIILQRTLWRASAIGLAIGLAMMAMSVVAGAEVAAQEAATDEAAEQDTEARVLKVTGSLWIPYLDDELPNGGLAADLVRTALTRAGYQVEANIESWPRAYQGAAIGVYDVVAAVWRNDARAADLLFSEAYLLNDIVLLSRPGLAVEFETLADLRGYRIGVVRGYAYDETFDRAGLNWVTNNHLIQNLLLLRQGKLDLIVGDKWSIFDQISRFMPDSLSGFTLVAQPVARRGLRLGVSRLNSDAATITWRFNEAITEMKSDGTYTAILKKHTGGIAVLPGKR
jgi:polar amino acid transport system substrate-binding protein